MKVRRSYCRMTQVKISELGKVRTRQTGVYKFSRNFVTRFVKIVKSVCFFVQTCFTLISRRGGIACSSALTLTVVRFGTCAHLQHTHMTQTHTCSCFRLSPSHCRYPRVLQRNSANHSRAYSDACHNERRATFCFGPVGRKYRPF